MLSAEDPARPQKKNTASADEQAEKHVVEFAENRLQRLSDSHPKNVDESMPGTLKLFVVSLTSASGITENSQRDQQCRSIDRQRCNLMSISIEICLGDSIARALKHDSHSIYVKCPVA